MNEANELGVVRYFLTAAAIESLCKDNASISRSAVGSQGEVGVACSMAPGGLVAALGGSNEQVECADETALEHNLGTTCDPVGGLVQSRCIERNASGAIIAVNADRTSMRTSREHNISLDRLIRIMSELGRETQARHKGIDGFFAFPVVEC